MLTAACLVLTSPVCTARCPPPWLGPPQCCHSTPQLRCSAPQLRCIAGAGCSNPRRKLPVPVPPSAELNAISGPAEYSRFRFPLFPGHERMLTMRRFCNGTFSPLGVGVSDGVAQSVPGDAILDLRIVLLSWTRPPEPRYSVRRASVSSPLLVESSSDDEGRQRKALSHSESSVSRCPNGEMRGRLACASSIASSTLHLCLYMSHATPTCETVHMHADE